MSRQLSLLRWPLTSRPNDHHILSVYSRLSAKLRLFLHDVSIRKSSGRWLHVFRENFILSTQLSKGHRSAAELCAGTGCCPGRSPDYDSKGLLLLTTNNNEAVYRDDNPQCHLPTPDPVYKRNAPVNNNASMLKIFC